MLPVPGSSRYVKLFRLLLGFLVEKDIKLTHLEDPGITNPNNALLLREKSIRIVGVKFPTLGLIPTSISSMEFPGSLNRW